MKKKILNDLSCIIPSLGRKTLNQTLCKLISGTNLPSEIIISLPYGYNYCLDKFKKKNIILKKIFTSRGQVKQRQYALKFTKKKFILQLDDDILIDKNCLKELHKTIKQNNSLKKVYGPVILNVKNKTKHKNNNCGKIMKSGVAYPLCAKCCKKNVNYVDWLPGGCVISHRKNIIYNNYFKFCGKAYFEDLFNSMERKKKNISHYIVKKAKVSLNSNHDNTLPIKDLPKYIKIKYNFVRKYFLINTSFYLSSIKIIFGNIFKSSFLIRS